MIASKLPSVLFQPNGNSVSLERIFNTAIELLETYGPTHAEDSDIADRVQICIEDLKTLKHNLF